MKIKKKNFPLKFSDLILLAFLGYSMGGSSSSEHMYISIGLLGMWIICALLSDFGSFRLALQDRKLLWLLLYLLFAFITGLIVGDFSFEIKQLVAGLYLFSPILIFNYFAKKKPDLKRINAIIFCVLAIVLYYSFKAILFYGQHTSAARYLAMDKEMYGDIAIGGGYSLAYGSAILSILLFSLVVGKRINSCAKRILSIIVILICSFVVFVTQSTIAVVCWAISIIVTVVFSGKRGNPGNKKAIFARVLIVLLASIVIFFSIPYIGRLVVWIASTQEGTFANRLREVGNMLMGVEAFGNSYAYNRFTIPFRSIETFFLHPFIGVNYLHGNNFLDSSLFGVGQHGEWADALANYGIIFGSLFIAIYVRGIKDVRKINPDLSPAWWICLILIGFFNPVRTFNANVVVFLVVPLIAIAVQGNKKVTQIHSSIVE